MKILMKTSNSLLKLYSQPNQGSVNVITENLNKLLISYFGQNIKHCKTDLYLNQGNLRIITLKNSTEFFLRERQT